MSKYDSSVLSGVPNYAWLEKHCAAASTTAVATAMHKFHTHAQSCTGNVPVCMRTLAAARSFHSSMHVCAFGAFYGSCL